MEEYFNFDIWWGTVSIRDAAANARAKAWSVEQFVTNFDALVELQFQHFPLDFPVGCKTALMAAIRRLLEPFHGD